MNWKIDFQKPTFQLKNGPKGGRPEHPPDDDDEPEDKGEAGDDDDHQHVVLD